ncbi:Glucose-inhibited division protein A [Planctomycetales bacterium 10988]|nr:Glucose-inhibited division protein A [Planctomycetales bacterium 10988]
MSTAFDCIVLGGGPAGSTTAALVAEQGHKTLLLERAKFPRYHVGESLMPDTFFTLERLGVVEKLKDRGFIRKYSVQFVGQSGRESAPFYFLQHRDEEASVTWQVERGEFDQLLFENAAEKGADCRDQMRVTDVLLDGDRVCGVKAKHADGEEFTFESKVVVDGTGQSSLLASKFDLKENYQDLRNAAIWTYYKGAHRDEGKDEGATIILYTSDRKSWFWYIPLKDDLVSVGVVSENDYLLRRGVRPQEAFEEELKRCPAMKWRIENGMREGDFKVCRDFSYSAKEPAGNGWVLVGDALGFLDPIYSSGVFLALKSGEMAADAIHAGLEKNDLSKEQLGGWAPEFMHGMGLIRQLVYAFYNEKFNFGHFIREFPQHKGNLVDLLVGRVFRPGLEQVFVDMETWLEKQSTDENMDSSKMTSKA